MTHRLSTDHPDDEHLGNHGPKDRDRRAVPVKHCEFCVHWQYMAAHDRVDLMGKCHRHAPSPVVWITEIHGGQGGEPPFVEWPVTLDIEGCGEFETNPAGSPISAEDHLAFDLPPSPDLADGSGIK